MRVACPLLNGRFGACYYCGAAKTVSWSSTLQEAVQAGLVCVHEAAGVIVLSHDQSTRLQLDPSGSMAIVTFPLTSCTAAPCRTGIQTQIFPVSCLPSRWAHSLQLALAALHVTRPCGGNHCKASPSQQALCSVSSARHFLTHS